MDNFKLIAELRQRVQKDFPALSTTIVESIVSWLVGRDFFELAIPTDIEELTEKIEYRYQILKRYLEVSPEKAYRKLITRLGSSVCLGRKIRAWVSVSRDRQRSVMDVLSEVINELLQSDRYIQEEMKWIAECTNNPTLKNTLLLTKIEEYCFRPINNQPLILFRFINYLRRISRGGLTYVPANQLVRLVSDEVNMDDNDSFISLVDHQASKENHSQNNLQQIYEEDFLCAAVKEAFSQYLADNVSATAVDWLNLHLEGYKPKEIAQALNLSSREVYHLRERVCYHAQHQFISVHWEVINDWLNCN